MRPTWHLVAAEDIRWMLKLSAGRIISANESYAKGRRQQKPHAVPAARRRRPGAQREPFGDGRLRLRQAVEHARARGMAHEAARGLSAQPPVVPHGRELLLFWFP